MPTMTVSTSATPDTSLHACKPVQPICAQLEEQNRAFTQENERLRQLFMLTQQQLMNLRLEALHMIDAHARDKEHSKELHQREVEQMRLECERRMEETRVASKQKIQAMCGREKEELRVRCIKEKEAMRVKSDKKREEFMVQMGTERERHEVRVRETKDLWINKLNEWGKRRSEEKKQDEARCAASIQDTCASEVKNVVECWTAFHEREKSAWNDRYVKDKAAWDEELRSQVRKEQRKWHGLFEEMRTGWDKTVAKGISLTVT